MCKGLYNKEIGYKRHFLSLFEFHKVYKIKQDKQDKPWCQEMGNIFYCGFSSIIKAPNSVKN